MVNWMKNRKSLIFYCAFAGMVVLAVFLRALYLYQFSSSPLFDVPAGPDVMEYDSWAREILSGHFFWSVPKIHSPLYPFFLAFLYKIFSYNFYLVRFFQGLLGFSGFCLLFFVLRRLGGKRRVWLSWLFLFFAAAYPGLIYYQSELLSEALLVPLLCIVVSILYCCDFYYRNSEKIDWKLCFWYAAAGLVSGMAVLTHPLALVFVVLEIAWCLLWYLRRKTAGSWRHRIFPGVIFMVVLLSVVLPVCWYNSTLEGGTFAVQANSGFNFYIGNNSEATGGAYLRPGDWEQVCGQGAVKAAKEKISVDCYFYRKAFSYIVAHPFEWVGLLFKKSIYVFNFREMVSGGDLPLIRYAVLLQSWFSWSVGLLFFLALLGMLINLRQIDFYRDYRHFLLLLISFWVALTVAVVAGRYRISMLPAVFLLAGCGVLSLYSLWSERKRLIYSLVCILIAACIVYLPAPHIDYSKQTAEAELMLGEAFWRKGKIDQAEKCYEKALLACNQSARAYCMLGIVYKQHGKFRKARDFFVKSIKLGLPTGDAYINLGLMSMMVRQKRVAEMCFVEALKKWPDSPMVLYNCGYYLLKTNRIKSAEKVLKKGARLAPADVNILNALGVLCLQQKRYQDALMYFERLMKIEPNNPGFLRNAAVVCIKTGRWMQAERYVIRLEKMQSNSKDVVVLKRLVKKGRAGIVKN
jgi:Tfp pilus assembly protein PilF